MYIQVARHLLQTLEQLVYLINNSLKYTIDAKHGFAIYCGLLVQRIADCSYNLMIFKNRMLSIYRKVNIL